MVLMLAGAVGMAFAVAGLLFLRGWRDTHDRLFLWFALAFFVLAVNRLGLAQATHQGFKGDALYWVRFLAFAIILAAIADKNRSGRKKSPK